LAVDFFSPIEIADRVDQILDHPTRMQHMRDAARQTAVSEYDFKTVLLPRWLSLMDDMMNGKRPKTEFAVSNEPVKPAAVKQTRAGKKAASG
jgi:hypothetical protein